MGYTAKLLDEVHAAIAASDIVLVEARARLHLVREAANTFPGSLRTYASGSLPQYTVIHPVSDGDGGLVLDRRCYPELGPEGGGQTPRAAVADLCALLGPEVRRIYRRAACGTSKRGPKVWFREPVEGQDPTVDLVLALTRRDGNGLWIPNLEKNTWEPSDPERHVEMLNTGSVSELRLRRRIIRSAKAWNKQYDKPGLSSHHLSMLAWLSVTVGQDVASALTSYFAYCAKAVAAGDTEDPAEVSAPLRPLIPRPDAVRRLERAAAALQDALDHDDDHDAVLAALSKLYPTYLTSPGSAGLTTAVAAVRDPSRVTTAMLGLAGPTSKVPPTRAYGSGSQ